MFFRKRGISSIVAIVAIIMITLAAVVIIVSYIIPLVRDSLNEGTECFGLEDYFKFDEDYGYNCYKNISGYNLYGLSVGADSGGAGEKKIKGLKLAFVKTGGTESFEIIEGDSVSSSNKGMRMVEVGESNLKVPEAGEVVTYVYNTSELFSEVRVLPILESDRTCEVTDSIRIKDVICDAATNFSL